MLLFIAAKKEGRGNRKIFQYISCYCLSKSSRRVHIPNLISIHLMLLFILFRTHDIQKQIVISIHLMLLFIITFIGILPIDFHFNTSHVTVYLSPSLPFSATFRISIHLMLLFILTTSTYRMEFPSFQYISCYCLSSCPTVCVLLKTDFNTSHVTVYHASSVDQ